MRWGTETQLQLYRRCSNFSVWKFSKFIRWQLLFLWAWPCILSSRVQKTHYSDIHNHQELSSDTSALVCHNALDDISILISCNHDFACQDQSLGMLMQKGRDAMWPSEKKFAECCWPVFMVTAAVNLPTGLDITANSSGLPPLRAAW